MATLRYTYRLRPGIAARHTLVAEWDRVRWVWNQCVEQRRRGVILQSRDLTDARRRLDWLREGSQDAQSTTVWTFSGKGRRALKRKRDNPSIGYTRNGFRLKGGLLRVKGAQIPVVWHRPLPSTPSSVRVFRDGVGHWYASFVVEIEESALPPSVEAVGIDWGVAVAATATDPDYDYISSRHAEKAQGTLAKYQRRMARRKPERGKPGSVGYQKAKRDAAKVAKKVARQRKHDAIQWSNRVVASHGLIAIEDFKPTFLSRSTMARRAADQSVGQMKRILIEKAQRAGREVVLVPPAYTTMTCSECGERQAQIGLSERTFRCADCGFLLDRDRNAARTILATAERTRAGVETVRHPCDLLSEVTGVRVEPESTRL